MHPRRAILDAIKSALAAATSPAYPVYEEDESGTALPCWQIAAGLERPGEATSRESYHVQLGFKVTARGDTPTTRDALSEALMLALVGVGAAGSFELEWAGVDLSRPREQVGTRTYPATYDLVASYFMGRI